MADTIRRSFTDTFEHTISGLLTKRSDLFGEAERIRDRLAEIKNDVAAINRVLGTLGNTGDLDPAPSEAQSDLRPVRTDSRRRRRAAERRGSAHVAPGGRPSCPSQARMREIANSWRTTRDGCSKRFACSRERFGCGPRRTSEEMWFEGY